MYDWIPMEFDIDILIYRGATIYERYHCIANSKDKERFRIFKDGHLVLSSYYRSSLMDAMNNGGKINGMTMAELKDSYYLGNEETEIDIGALI